MRTPVLTATAPAKLNLDLYVIGPVSEGPHRGYHRIDSLVVFIDLADTVTAAPAEDLSLVVDGPFAGALSAGRDNLVVRAAHALAEAAGVDGGARLTLHKQIPVAAGLGGGSADAAAVLRLLVRLWGVRLPDAEIAEMGLRLGGDVPVCLHGRPGVMGGVGETLVPAPALPPALSVVLANPGLPLATADVFAARQGAFSNPPVIREVIAGRNDLEPAARSLMPEIAPVLDCRAAAPGARAARMTGSGPTGFALFDSGADAAAAAAQLAAVHPDWWVRSAAIARDSSSG